MSTEITEMQRLQKSLPPRPCFSELERAFSTIQQVYRDLGVKRDELDRQKRPQGVPVSAFETLQEMRREVLEDEAYQQRQPAEAICRLEQRHRLYDAWIQEACDSLVPSLSLLMVSCSHPAVEVALESAAPAGKKSTLKGKRHARPSECSRTSATHLSSAPPLVLPIAVDDEQANDLVSGCINPADDVTKLQRRPSGIRESKRPSSERSARVCHWSEDETFLLIYGNWKLAEEMRLSCSAAFFTSKQQRWEFVARFLGNLKVHKTWQQCANRWNRLWKPFKIIHAYESNALAKNVSYWKLSPSERVDNRLPHNFSIKFYEVLKKNFFTDKTADT